MSKERTKAAKRSGGSNAVTAKKGNVSRAESDEAEVMRRQLLADAGEVEEVPGQLDALLDRAYLADSFFEEHVLQDAACLRSPDLFREAWAVARALADFYQRIGQELGKERTSDTAVGDAARANS
jgi:hypothetical protein